MTRVTVIGAGTSAPQPETPASGILVETASTAILVDCGQSVIRGLMPVKDPRELDAIIVGHLHADHYIDLVSLRYLMPWAGFTGRRIPVLLPPGGKRKLDELASAISEREGFFDHTFEIIEYDDAKRVEIGDLSVEFIAGLHYVPAWGCLIRDRAGRLVAISGDTGPNDTLVEAARGADVFIVEATLVSSADDDPRRGHLTYDEALDMGARAGAGRTVLVHHRTQNREAILAACAAQRGAVLGMPGLAIDVAAPSPAANGRPEQDQVGGVGSIDAGAMDVDRPAGSASRAARAR